MDSNTKAPKQENHCLFFLGCILGVFQQSSNIHWNMQCTNHVTSQHAPTKIRCGRGSCWGHHRTLWLKSQSGSSIQRNILGPLAIVISLAKCSKSEDHCLGKTPKYVKLIIFWGGEYMQLMFMLRGKPHYFGTTPPCAFQGKKGLDAVRFFFR